MITPEDDYASYWDRALQLLKESIPKNEADTWLSKMAYVRSEEGKLFIAVSSKFTMDYIKRKYKDTLTKDLCEMAGQVISIQFEIHSSHELNQLIRKRSGQADEARKETDPINILTKISQESQVYPDKTENLENKTDISSILSVDDDGKIKKKQLKNVDPNMERREASNLTARYTFDAFVPGDNSSFAYNAATVIAKNPGVNFNPCLIYGGVGLGKTHLLQSIGNYIIDHNARQKVVYVTAEMFTNEFIEAIKTGQTQQFKNKFRKVNVLLIDDIHFLSGKSSTQEELFHTFNDLYETKRQMVFTCDRPISELKDITERLKSRFERGLNVDLQPPKYETKFAILKKKCEEQRTQLPDAILDYLCNSINTNVRDLEAALLKLTAYSSLLKEHMTLEKAQKLIGIMPTTMGTSSVVQTITVDTIIKVTAEHFKVSPYDLKGKKRTKRFVIPRQVAMYLSREMTVYSTTEIGTDFGRDHTTVMHAIERIESLTKTDTELEKIINSIKVEILNFKNN